MRGPNDRLSIFGLGDDDLRPLQRPNMNVIESAVNARRSYAPFHSSAEHPTVIERLRTHLQSASVLLTSSPYEEIQAATKVIFVVASGRDIYWPQFFQYVLGDIRMNIICPRDIPEEPEQHLITTWFLNKEWRSHLANDGEFWGPLYQPIEDMINAERFKVDYGRMTIQTVELVPAPGVTVEEPHFPNPVGRIIRPGQHHDLDAIIRVLPIETTGALLQSDALSPEQARAFGQLEEMLGETRQQVLTVLVHYTHSHLPANTTMVVRETLTLRRSRGERRRAPLTPPAALVEVPDDGPEVDQETVATLQSGYWSDVEGAPAVWEIGDSPKDEEEEHGRARQIWRNMRQFSQHFPPDKTRSAATTQLTLPEPVLQIKAEALKNKRSIGQDTLRSIAKSFLGL
jgi:hypothetical protein